MVILSRESFYCCWLTPLSCLKLKCIIISDYSWCIKNVLECPFVGYSSLNRLSNSKILVGASDGSTIVKNESFLLCDSHILPVVEILVGVCCILLSAEYKISTYQSNSL